MPVGTLLAASLATGLATVAVVAADVANPAPAQAAPGSPGVMEAPSLSYFENFENIPTENTSTFVQTLADYPNGAAPGSPGFQPGYVGRTGMTYTADPQWNGQFCNGLVMRATTPKTDTTTPLPSAASAAACATTAPANEFWTRLRYMAADMGTYVHSAAWPYTSFLAGSGQPASDLDNHQVAAFTNGNPGNGTELEFKQPLPVTPGHYFSFSVDEVTMSCINGATVARPQFTMIQQDGTSSPAFSTIPNVCDPAQTVQIGGNANARMTRTGTFLGDTPIRATGNSLRLRLQNLTNSGSGNDSAWDNILILDTTPKVDKQFSTGPREGGGYPLGATGKLTFTVTNTYNPLAPTQSSGPKLGWSFTDAMPAGLQVKQPLAFTTTCANGAMTGTPSSLSATGDLSGANVNSCTFTVDVTSNTAGTYTNGPSNVTTSGLLAPGSTSITFLPPPAPGSCPTDATLWQSPATGQTTNVKTVNLVTGVTNAGATVAGAKINSVGYNVTDGNYYGYIQAGDAGGQALVRISPDFSTVTNLGAPDVSSTGFPLSDFGTMNTGDVSPAGIWYGRTNTPTNARWLAVDVNPGSPTYLQTVGGGQTGTGNANQVFGADWSFNPADGNLYSVGYNANTFNAQVFRFDPRTGTTTLVASPGRLTAPNGVNSQQTNDPQMGATYADSNGYLYAANNGTGHTWRINMNNPTDISFFSYGPASNQNDGARCVNAPLPLDFGDAPDSYTTTLNSGGPLHQVTRTAGGAPSVMIGSTVTLENDGRPSAAANLDSDDAFPANPVYNRAAGTISQAVPITNNAGQPATLAGWIDFNNNGTFDSAEAAVTSAGTTTHSVTLTWTVPAGVTPPVSSYLRLRVSLDTAPAAAALALAVTDVGLGAVSGEVEDWQVGFATPGLQITKSAAPSQAIPGGKVTYTVRVTNTGQVPYTSTTPATFTDNLATVLDDATYNGDASASAGTATFASPTLSWSGPLAVGATATITYSVTVSNPLTGNGILSNAVTGPPESNCAVPTSVGCTTTTPVRALTIVKTSGAAGVLRPGDSVGYTVRVTNSGKVAYTVGDPATFTDSLAAVLDDATYNGDAAASAGTVSFATPNLSWTGPLAPGATATITYSVTVNAPVSGDGVLTNGVRGPPESTCAVATSSGCAVRLGVRALTIVKTPTPGSAAPGDTVTYSVVVTNSGGVAYTAADPARFSDDLTAVLDDATYNGDGAASAGTVSFASPTLSWSGALAVDAVATITYSVTVKDPDPGDGALRNAVTGPPESSCAAPTAGGCTTTTPVLARGLRIAKTSSPTGQVLPGRTVTYTVRVTNTGEIDYTAAHLATFSDDLTAVLDDATWNGDATASAGTATFARPRLSWSGPLAVGATATITYSVTVNNPLTGNGTLTNAVTGPPESTCAVPTAAGCTTMTLVRALQIEKSSAPTGQVAPGGVVTYTVRVTNTGQVPYTAAAPATFSDDLTAVLDDARYNGDATASAGTATFATPKLSWSGALAPGATATITYSVTVNDPLSGNGTLTNAVTGPPESSCADPTADGCTTTTLVRALQIVKRSAPSGSTTPGGTVTYTVTVTNTGQVAYTAVDPATFSDELTAVLDDATYNGDAVASAGAVVFNDPTITWSGPLAPGGDATITYSVTVNDPLSGDGTLTNAVTGPPESTCAESTVDGCSTTTLVQALQITKTASPTGDVTPGGTVTYTVTVTNTGQVAYTAADPADFSDDLSAVLDDATYNGDAAANPGTPTYTAPTLGWSGALEPGAVATITYSVTVNDPVSGDGTLTNAVTGPPESTCADPTADGCTTTTSVRALEITKTSTPTGEVVPGSVVTYTVQVTNTGGVDYTAVDPATFSDDLTAVLDDATYDGNATADVGTAAFNDPSLSWSGPLAAGDDATITYSVTVNDPVTGDGRLTNAVTGPPESTCADPTADGCSTTTPVRALTITKTASPAGQVTPGGVVTYTVAVTNSGQVAYTTADPATFSDDLTAVLDDATWNDDAAASTGTASFTTPVLTWSGPLVAGATATITYSVTVNDPLTGDGTLTNAVTGPPESTCPDATTDGCTTTTPVRSLSIVKTASPAGAVTPGGTVTYTVTVTNSGQSAYPAADPATFSDELTAVLDDASYNGDAAATAGTVAFNDPTLTWSGALAPGDDATITYSVTVNDPLTGDGTLTNAVTGPPESTCADPTADGCTTSTAVQSLSIVKASSPTGTVTPGGVVTYTVRVTNTGQVPYTATDPATFADDLSAVLDDATWNDDAVASAGTATFATPALSWSGALAPGDEATITYSVTVNDPLSGDGTLTNAVTGPPESTCADPTDDGCTTTTLLQSLEISKTSSPTGEVTPAGTVTYSVTVTNTGQAPYTAADPATFSDDLSAVLDDAAYNGDAVASTGTAAFATPALSWSGALAPGDEATITYSVTVNDPLSGDGTLTNAVTGPPESTCADPTDDGCSTTTQVRALQIVKTSSPTGEVTPTGKVTYTVKVTNTGQVPYTATEPATFSDDLSAVLDDATYNDDAAASAGTVSFATPTLSWSGPLAAGATATITYSVTVNDPPSGDGTLTNAVTGPAESTCADPTAAGCTTTTLVRALQITKTAAPTGEVLPGGVVTYTVVVTNSGGAAYTAGEPATFADDLSDVLDDAAYDGNAAASAGTATYTAPTLSWSGPLAVDASATITYSVTVNDPVTGDGLITNAVTGPPESSCADGDGPGCTTTTPVRSLTIVKTSEPSDEVAVGDSVLYTVKVTNSGQVPYTATDPATFDDDLTAVLDDATWDDTAAASAGEVSFTDPTLSWSGALDVGATATVTYSVTVDDPTPGDGTLTNAVTGPPESTCGDPTAAGCTTEMPVLTRGLDIVKSQSARPTVGPGETIAYTVTVTNSGQVAYTPVHPASFSDDLTDVVDDATWGDDATASAGVVAYSAPTLRWAGPLAVGATATVTYSVTVNDPLTGNGTLTNAVTGPPESTCADPTVDGCTVTAAIRALRMAKAQQPSGDVVPGDVVTYTLTAENIGAVPYVVPESAKLTDRLTDVLDDASWNGDLQASLGRVGVEGEVIGWDGSLDPGDTVTITYSVTVKPPGAGNGRLPNVLVGPPDSNCPVPLAEGARVLQSRPLAAAADAPLDPDCSTEATVLEPGLTITKTASPTGSVDPGDTVRYTVEVVNSGEIDYTATDPATITDDLTGVLDDATYNGSASASSGTTGYTEPLLTWSGALAVGASATITYSVTVGDPPAGDAVLGNVVTGPDASNCSDGTADACRTLTPIVLGGSEEPGPPSTPGTPSEPASGLPRTGADVLVMGWLALALLLSGAVCVVAAQRRQRRIRVR
ncbi:DUF7927 domain-containing protein [Angustibacter luteus]|uniref:GEVED domain-containing protein n=1 Tax=Angustibacter luteus TaxID=658456 RepID=A0ABW1JCY3_9ACTN